MIPISTVFSVLLSFVAMALNDSNKNTYDLFKCLFVQSMIPGEFFRPIKKSCIDIVTQQQNGQK